MERISILLASYNEENNIILMYDKLTSVMKEYVGKYDYEIIYRDNSSTDKTLEKLKNISCNDKHLKVDDTPYRWWSWNVN